MRNRDTIEREIYRAREDLEASLNELRHVVQEKVDVKARARVAIEKGKDGARELANLGAAQARHLANRAKDGSRDIYIKGRETVQERPVLVGVIAASVIALGAFIYIARKNDWFRREQLT